MGRVRRYKKYRACDPASRSGRSSLSSNADLSHDEPPELFERRARARQEQKQSAWDDESQRERMLQREALRSMRADNSITAAEKSIRGGSSSSSSGGGINQQPYQLEGKRADESSKDFKLRIRQETRKTLAVELRKLTSTAQKRKARLKERSTKRKQKKGKGKNVDEYQEVVEFFSAEDGRLRPSDRGEVATSFRNAEQVGFGERISRPPDLKTYADKLNATQRKKAKQQQQQQQQQQLREEQEEEQEEAEDAEPRRKKRRRKRDSIMYRDDMDGGIDDSAAMRSAAASMQAVAAATAGAGVGVSATGTVGSDGASSGIGKIRALGSSIVARNSRQGQGQAHGQQNTNTAALGKGGNSSSKSSSMNSSNHSNGSSGSIIAGQSSAGRGSAGPGSSSQQSEMELLRARVQGAYKALKEKRRLERQ